MDNQTLTSRWRRLKEAFWPEPPDRTPALPLYTMLAGHARDPFYYRDLGVPDTPEGRFEVLALHLGLVTLRLIREGTLGRQRGQELFDLMVADLDASLREIGIGDLSVGKHVKRLVGQFYARLDALGGRRAEAGFTDLRPMLYANVYAGGAPPAPAVQERLEAALTALAQAVEGQDGAALLAGRIDLPKASDLPAAAGQEPGGGQGRGAAKPLTA